MSTAQASSAEIDALGSILAASRYSTRMRLDGDKLDALRRWARGLQQLDREESAAAGRAILMLIEELERLRLELWRTREQLSRIASASGTEGAAGTAERVASTLHERLQQVLTPPSAEEDETETTSPQSWIDSLRRRV
jgi:hypothetical protein